MSSSTITQAPFGGATAAIDRENPWPGLDTFTEQSSAYFFGRDEEVRELLRRVERKSLTVLFGQSGLGKSSLLQAGAFPRLREELFCPVYVRLDHSASAPSLTEQVKAHVFRETAQAGSWTKTGSTNDGEALWEFFHHRDDHLRNAGGDLVTPVLVFDQFEELFTVGGAADPETRRRAEKFIGELAELVENRPPEALEKRMEESAEVAELYDFARADYRVLISLREDYLPHLESLKDRMPSLMQNRMRLTRLPAPRAMEAVLKPGGGLVTEEVAKQIVYFVAGRGETENVEVEPSLLNLVCRELNNHRRTRKEETISTDLLAGSRDTILKEFYERTLEDQPPAVRSFIENELLTESGYRENIALERARKALTNAGANPRALDVLVNRRLLRVEERLDIRRVELTHDVLCSVVKASRDMRLEREAKAEAQRQLALQKEREAATRQALMRARMIAAVCAVLAVGALGGAIFGYLNMRRAWAAERKAQEVRKIAERGRTEAEKLIVYLLDDFYLELEPIGRLDIVGELAKRALDYYREIPQELQTPETERNRALALVRYGAILRNQDRVNESEKALTEAVETLTRLQKAGDRSELATVGLALGLSNESRVYWSLNKADEAKRFTADARAVIDPLMTAPNPSVAARRAYGVILHYQGFLQLRTNDEDAAIRSLQRAQDVFRDIDGLKLTDMPSAAAYTESAAWLVEALIRAGRVDDARKVGQEAATVAGRLLEKRPGHTSALRSRAIISANMAEASVENLRIREALALSEASYRDWSAMNRIDPSNTIARNNEAAASMQSAGMMARLGRIRDAVDRARGALDQDSQNRSVLTALTMSYGAANTAVAMADLGDLRQAEAAIADTRQMVDFGTREMPADSFDRAITRESISFLDYALPEARGDYKAVHTAGVATLGRIEQMKPKTDGEKRQLNELLLGTTIVLARASYRLKDYATAEKEIQQAMAYRLLLPNRTAGAERDASEERTMLGMILAQQQRFDEAWKIIEPDLKMHRDLKARGSDDVFQHLQLVTVLYAAALAQPASGAEQSIVYLDEANGILDAMPVQMKKYRLYRELRDWIADEKKART